MNMQISNEKLLKNIRIIDKRLLYVSGIPKVMNNFENLSSKKYFGQFGEIINIKLTPSRVNSVFTSAYITFDTESSCKNAIITIDGSFLECETRNEKTTHIIRCTFGTTKYCNSYIRKQPCSYFVCKFIHYKPTDDLIFPVNRLCFSNFRLDDSENVIKLHNFNTLNQGKKFLPAFCEKSLIDLEDSSAEEFNNLDFGVKFNPK